MTENNDFFTEDDTIHFSCNQCGKCCAVSPNVDFYEMLGLADEFVFTIHHHSHLSKNKSPLNKEIIKHLELLGHTIIIPTKESAFYYYIDFKSIELNSYKGCSKLVDNKCSIYNQRPSQCKISPIDIRYPENRQWEAIKIFKENTIQKDWKCSFSKDDTVIFENKEIKQMHTNSLYFRNMQNIRAITDGYINFLQINPKNFNAHLENVYNANIKSQQLYSDMVIPLKSILYNNLVSNEVIQEFVEKQLILIDKKINYAVNNKIKEDKDITNLYKRQKDNYLKAIENNVFSDTDGDY